MRRSEIIAREVISTGDAFKRDGRNIERNSYEIAVDDDAHPQALSICVRASNTHGGAVVVEHGEEGMDGERMTESADSAYVAGQRSAFVRIMQDCAREIGYSDPLGKASALIEEREQVRAALRRVCSSYGIEFSERTNTLDALDELLQYLETDE